MDDPDPLLVEAPLPGAADLGRHLDAWWEGSEEREDLRDWAADLVDRVVFPDLPTSDPRSAALDLVLQLASDLPLARADIPAMRAFLLGGERAWATWHAYVAGRDWAYRRRNGWAPGK